MMKFNQLLVLTTTAIMLTVYCTVMLAWYSTSKITDYIIESYHQNKVDVRYDGRVKYGGYCFVKTLDGKLLKYPLSITCSNLLQVLKKRRQCSLQQAVLVHNGRYISWNNFSLEKNQVQDTDIIYVGIRLLGGVGNGHKYNKGMEQRSEYEKIVTSAERLQRYVKGKLPDHCIRKVLGDGLCILRAFREGLHAAHKRDVSLSMLKDNLRSEILTNYNFYREFSPENVDILTELDLFLNNPLKYYNTDTCDIFLTALGNHYKTNTIIYHSDDEKSWTVDNSHNFETTLYFAKSIADHIDAVVPITEINVFDSDTDCEITKLVEGNLENKWDRLKEAKIENDLVESDDSDIVYMGTTPGDQYSLPVKYESASSEESKQRHGCTQIFKEIKEPSIQFTREPAQHSAEFTDTCTQCHMMFSDKNSFIKHVLNCTASTNYIINTSSTDEYSPDSSGEESTCLNSTTSSESEIDNQINCFTQRVLTRSAWHDIPLTNVSNIPADINGLTAYVIKGSSRTQLLKRSKDGRPWKKDTKTNWSGYQTVRYKNCNGSLSCPNSCCPYRKQYDRPNKLKFDKNKVCVLCGAIGVSVPCNARKYIAFVNDKHVEIFHYGNHTCMAKIPTNRPTELVIEAIKINPCLKPSAIQGNAILSAMRSRKSWAEVRKVVKKVTDKRAISNEKIKQRQSLYAHGTSFTAVKDYKKYCDEIDKYLVYSVDENCLCIFKTSNIKMKLAGDMTSSDNFLSQEFCCFDGKVKRCRNFVTLTASVYHPLLQKQIPLAIMECATEDSQNISYFWDTFNRAYREVNECTTKFLPTGWVTDMATANFNGLERIYGNDVLDKIKGCEFHYRNSINRHSSVLAENGDRFKWLATELLLSGTTEAYTSAHENILTFLNSVPGGNSLLSWLDWWHKRRFNMFRAFTGHECPRSNQAEVIHAGWTNRDPEGLTLYEAAEFDTKDTLLIESELEDFEKTPRSYGCGPSMNELKERNSSRHREAANRKGQDLLQHGVNGTLKKRKAHFSTDSVDGCNPPKTKSQTINNMFEARLMAANNAESNMKVRKSVIVNTIKRTYAISNTNAGRKRYDVDLANVPKCTCADFRKNGKKVCCKHILFVVLHVLSGTHLVMQLKNKYFSDDDLKTIYERAGKMIPERYKQTLQPQKKDFKAILREHAKFNNRQVWFLHKKERRSAKCVACQKIIEREIECFVVHGALTVPYQQDKAVEQRFYYCAQASCIANRPRWTNLRAPDTFRVKDGVPNERAQTIAETVNLAIEQD